MISNSTTPYTYSTKTPQNLHHHTRKMTQKKKKSHKQKQPHKFNQMTKSRIEFRKINSNYIYEYREKRED